MEKLFKVLANLAQATEKEVLDLKENEDELTKFVETKIAERFKKIGTDQYGRATKEALTAKQKAIAAKYNIAENPADIESLIELIVESEKEKGGNNGQASALEEQNKTLQEQAKALKQQLKEAGQKVSEIEKQRAKDKVLMRVEAEAEREFAALGIMFPEDEQVAKRAKNYLISQLLSNEYEIDQTGKIQPLGKDGAPLQNEKYENVGLKELILQNNMFPLKSNQTPPNPPNPKGGGGGGNKYNFTPDQLKADNVVNEVKKLQMAGKLDDAKALQEAYMQQLSKEE